MDSGFCVLRGEIASRNGVEVLHCHQLVCSQRHINASATGSGYVVERYHQKRLVRIRQRAFGDEFFPMPKDHDEVMAYVGWREIHLRGRLHRLGILIVQRTLRMPALMLRRR